MYSGSGFSDWEIGDITVIVHDGVYHLFHLIIPNHDYIAHAVSADGMSWRRTDNAIFVGHPGEWDDDMLWTMHVCYVNGKFEMYYTGLERRDRGGISRVGLAISDDLITWEKVKKPFFPIEPKGVYYEASNINPRTWLSFRDPFRFEYRDDVYLLICTRTINGPVSRRGCVGLVRITNDEVERLPPLLYPMVYDDIECPCIFELRGKVYLLGSIREDVKVRYWYSSDFFGEYHSFEHDILLPPGNYAARTVEDDGHLLVYNFYFAHGQIDALRVLPPPKEIHAGDDGRLFLTSYYRWEQMVQNTVLQKDIEDVKLLLSNPSASYSLSPDKWTFGSRVGYEIFCFPVPSSSYIWEGLLTIEGLGKLGLVCNMDKEGNGYFVSIDIKYGRTQIRAWGFNPLDNRQNFIFNNIQSGFFETDQHSFVHFKLIRYGNYIELSINNVVILTLMDYTYSGGGIGLYSASSIISLENSIVKLLPDPMDEYASQKDAQIFG